MTVEQRKLEKDLCRCCHAEGSFKNLGISWYNPLGEEEIYSNMLREQLGLDIYPVSGLLSEVTYKICDPCIVRLRDATDFRKQVQTCEAKFSDLISKNVFQVAVPFVADVKVEMEEDIFEGMKAEDDDADDGFEPTNFDDDEDNKDEVQTLLQLKQETKKGKGKGKATAKTKAKPVAAKAKKATAKATAKATKAKKAIKEETDAMIMELPAASGEAEKKKKGLPKKTENLAWDFRRSEDGWTCNSCSLTVGTEYSIKRHLNTSCIWHRCHFCLERYSNVTELEKHCLKEHSEEYYCVCDYCGSKKPTRARLLFHLRYHHNPHICKKCDLTVNGKINWLKHLVEKHGRPLATCTICSFKSIRKVHVNSHMKNVHLKDRIFVCEICLKECRTRQAINNHRKIHDKIRKFVCEFCKKAFKTSTHLDYHRRIHTGEKTKVCPVCQMAFVQKASLNYHMIKHHPNHPM